MKRSSKRMRVSKAGDGSSGSIHGAVTMTTVVMFLPMAERGVPLAIIP